MSKERFVIVEESLLSEVVAKAVETAMIGYFKEVSYYSHATHKDKYLTRSQAASLLLITPTTLSKWVRGGVVKNWGKGRKMLFKISDIEKLK